MNLLLYIRNKLAFNPMPDRLILQTTDSFNPVLDSIIKANENIVNYTSYEDQLIKERTEAIETGLFFTFIVIVLVHAVYKIIKNDTVDTTIVYNNNNNTRETTSELSQKYLVYRGSNMKFSTKELKDTLNKYHDYFKNLNPLLQSTFINRLKQFIANKIFVIHAKEGYKEMPILLSAAAIQLTFGLEGFLLPYFKYLQIHPEEYFSDDNSLRVLEGHVRGNSITIAFNRLIKGNANATDGSNVGLHEMAHALYFQEIEVDTNKKAPFDKLFEKVLHEGEEVFELKDKTVLFSNYAFINLQEFWAESVELFFERPVDLKNHFPELFDILKNLLKQNPHLASNPL